MSYKQRIAAPLNALPFALVALLLTLAAGLPAVAQEETVAGDVAMQATGGNGQRKVASDSSGVLYAIYAAPLEGEDAIIVAKSTDDGSTWQQETVLSRPGIRAGLGTLAFDPSGVLHASWVDYETVGHVWYATRTDTWSEPSKISPGPHYAGFPAMVADGGGVHVLWYGAKPNPSYSHGSEYEIRHTYLTESGWSSPKLVSIGSFDALNPTADIAPDGTVVAAWYQKTGDHYRADVAAWDGSRWAIPKSISPVAGNAVAVSMDTGPDGTVHLIWQQFRGDIPGIVYAALRDGTWSDPEFVADGPASNPVVAAEGDGRVVGAWSTENGIETRRWDGSWGSTVSLGAGDFASLLPGDPVQVLWTRPQGDGFELVFAEADFPIRLSTILIALVVIAAVAGLGALLVRRRSAR